ncbi:hypothetical protein Tco_1503194 [Tanacetum coccineum]
MGNVKKSIVERTRYKREYNSRVNKRQLQTQEGKVVMIEALDVNFIVMESSGKESEKQVQALDANLVVTESNIKPTYDEEPMAEVQLTAECNIFAKEQQHAEQSDLINERRVDQDVVQCQDKCPLLTTLTDTKPNEQSYQFLESENSIENADLRAQIQEKVFANPVLKNKLRKLTGTSVDTKFAKPLILEKQPLQTNRKHPVVRKPTTFKSERPQTSKSRNSSKNVSTLPLKETFSSNNMVYNYNLEEARKKRQERNRNLNPSVMHFASLQNTANVSKPKPRSNNQTSRNLPVECEHPLGSNTDITNLHECEQNLDSSAGTYITIQKEHTLDLRADTSFNLTKDGLKAMIKENVIVGRPRSQGIPWIK